MREDLGQVIADSRSDADHLGRLGFERESKLLRDFARRVELAAEPFTTFLSERDAALFSGLSPRALRRKFYEWEPRGLARRQGSVRMYREIALPRRADVVNAHNDGRAAARQGAEVG